MNSRQTIRSRALRAAQSVTLAAALGCSTSHPGEDADVRDASITPDAPDDAQLDAQLDASNDAQLDAQLDASNDAQVDALVCPGVFPPTTEPCCTEQGGFWDTATGTCAVAVPGPFVPPALG